MGEVVSCYRAWRFVRQNGSLEGLFPLDPEALPWEHCRLVHDDENGLLIRLEEYRPGLPTPEVKVFGYNSPEDPVIREAVDYNPDGSIRLIHRYDYDEAGRMMDREELDGQGNTRGHVESSWDEDKEIEERVYTAEETLRSTHRYGYDEAGNVISEEILGPDGSPQGRREMAYDARGNVTGKSWFGPDGVLRTRYVHTYDDQDRIVRSQLYGPEGELRGEQAFAWDEVGNPTFGTP